MTGPVDLDRPCTELPWVVVDVEGNGQRPPDLVEAACLPIDVGRPGTPQTWLVRPPRPITPLVSRIHGIRNATVADAPPVATVADEIRAALAGRIVIGHNVRVDLAVLARELDGWQPPAVLDTLRLARTVWPGRPSYRLDALLPAITPPAPGRRDGADRRHRAGHDTTLTADLFLTLTRALTATAGSGLTARQLLDPTHVADADRRLF